MDRKKLVTLGAVGDISYLKGVNTGVRNHGFDWPFELIQPQLDTVDILFGNMECVLLPPDYPQSAVDPRALIAPFPGSELGASLVRAGFTFLNLAQNHILDAGVLGMNHTREVLESTGLKTGGVGNSQMEARRLVIIERSGLKFGFLCYCEDNNYVLGTRGPCHAYYEHDSVISDVERARESVDILVVSIHADIEFMPVPSLPRRRTFRAIAEAGAHVILGHHPHVPQGCELHQGSLIAYSLGNFLFPAHSSTYMREHLPRTAHSFLLKVQLGPDGVSAFERIPMAIRGDEEERPVPLSSQEAGALLKYFAQLDAHLEDDTFLQETWRRVARAQLAKYLTQAVEISRESTMQRRLVRLFKRFGIRLHPNIDRVVEEFVTRLCLTQENRLWMEEIFAMGLEAHEARLSAEPDPYHRPHFRFEDRERTARR